MERTARPRLYQYLRSGPPPLTFPFGEETCMKPFTPNLLLLGIGTAWVPYLTLWFYWRHLLATVPGADHGEVSGPILYFLPRLLTLAVVLSLVLLAILLCKRARRLQLTL